MPPYVCYFCNKQFFQRSHLQNHFSKKYKCKFKKYDLNNMLKTDISRDDMILMFESEEYHNLFLEDENMNLCTEIAPKCTEIAPKCTEIAPKCTEIAPKCTEMTPKDSEISLKNIECEYCHKIFTRNSTKNRHIREKRCNILKNNLQITNCNNTMNNITINNTQNNIQNNTQNNIHINCYGKENLSYITNDILQDIIKKPLSGIPKLIEMIHLNPQHPENNNIKLVNKNLPFLDYFNGSYWKTADKSKVLGNLLKSKAELTDKYFEDNEDIEDENISKLYPKYSDAIRYVVSNFNFEDPLLKYKPSKKALVKIYKKLEKDLYTMILNHREFVKDICTI
jgi:hypothetical protein